MLPVGPQPRACFRDTSPLLTKEPFARPSLRKARGATRYPKGNVRKGLLHVSSPTPTCPTSWHFVPQRSVINRGDIASRRNRFGIAVGNRPTHHRGGSGFKSSRRGLPVTAPGLMRRFFLLPKLLISFPEIKHSNVDPGDFSKEFKGSQPGHLPIPRFIFRACLGPPASKNRREIPGGGRGAAMTTEGAA